MKVYKIRNKDGLFSTGGMRPTWTKQGKVWQQLGHVHSHIQQLTTGYTPADVYKDADVVEAEITEILTPIEPASEWLMKTYDEQILYYEEYAQRTGSDYWTNHVNTLKARRGLL